jgi:translocation and assembly module TamA
MAVYVSARLATAGLALSLVSLCAVPLLAQEAVPQTVPAASADGPDLNAPMEELPGIGVDWPDMNVDPFPTDSPDVPTATAVDEDGERRYRVSLEGVDEIQASPVRERFDLLSTLRAGQGKAANSAQIDRRVREDTQLLETILRAAGHYDPDVESRVETGKDGVIGITFTVVPGPVYRFTSVDVHGLADAGAKAPALEAAFGVNEQDAIDADDVLGGQAQLETTLKQSGFPFAKVAEPDVVVDHDSSSGTLALKVETGGERDFGAIRVIGDDPPFGVRHTNRIARFNSGELYNQAMVEDLRRALVATGVVSDVSVLPVPGVAPGTADIEVQMSSAPPRTISGEAGYGTGEGAKLDVSWTHRNLLGPEGALTVRGLAGTEEQLASAIIRKSNFRKRDVVLNATLSAANVDRAAYDARTIQLSANVERLSNIIWHKKWTWSGGLEFLITDERDFTDRSLLQRRRTYLVAAAPLAIGYDRSNSLLDPTTGFRLNARISPEISKAFATKPYVRAQLDATAYFPVTPTVTMAGRARVGTILGAGTVNIAPSRRFYAGGGSSVRGYGYQMVGPRDIANDPIGGRSLAEFSLEARVRWRDFGIVPFIDAGNIYDSATPKFSGFRYGAGVGLRYHSSFGPIRIDVGTPLSRQQGDPRVTVFVSLGQAF